MEKEIEINYDEFHNLYEKAKKEKKIISHMMVK